MSADPTKYNKPNKLRTMHFWKALSAVSVASFCIYSYYKHSSSKINVRAISKNIHIGDGKLMPKIKLNNGLEIPVLGLGTWGLGDIDGKGFNKQIINNAINHAIDIGYRHIDTASDYLNEHIIGDTLNKLIESNKISRNELFITSKLNQNYHSKQHVRKQLIKTLKDLRINYLDLFLIHWPMSFEYVDFDDNKRGFNDNYDPWETTIKIPGISLQETWKAMEELVDEGLVKSIGVSNFNVQLLYDLLTYSRIKPVVNQIEMHPYLQQTELLNFCKYVNVQVIGFSPLGTPGNKDDKDEILLNDNLLNDIAQKYQVSCAQIALKWNIQRGVVVVTKSNNIDRISENKSLMHFKLSDDDMNTINALNKNLRYLRPEDWGLTKNLPMFA